MPSFLSHDFYFNFVNSYNTDKELNNELIADELAKIIVFETNSVKKALLKNSIKFPENVNEKGVADLVYKNKGNENLRSDLLSVITKNHPLNVKSLFNENNQTKLKTALENLRISLIGSFDFNEKLLDDKVMVHLQHKKLFETRRIDPKHLVLTGVLVTIVVMGCCAIIYKVYTKNKGFSAPKPDVNDVQATPLEQPANSQPLEKTKIITE